MWPRALPGPLRYDRQLYRQVLLRRVNGISTIVFPEQVQRGRLRQSLFPYFQLNGNNRRVKTNWPRPNNPQGTMDGGSNRKKGRRLSTSNNRTDSVSMSRTDFCLQ